MEDDFPKWYKKQNGEHSESNKITFQHPRRTPVEVNRTLSKIISKGQSLLATALTAATSPST